MPLSRASYSHGDSFFGSSIEHVLKAMMPLNKFLFQVAIKYEASLSYCCVPRAEDQLLL